MNLEHSFVVHFIKIESVAKFWDLGVRSCHFFDDGVKELFDYTIDYYTRSELTKTVTKELLVAKFPDWFEMNAWPEEEYVPEVITEELLNKYRRIRVEQALIASIFALVPFILGKHFLALMLSRVTQALESAWSYTVLVLIVVSTIILIAIMRI